jgi:uridine kinase
MTTGASHTISQRASARVRAARGPVISQLADFLLSQHQDHPLRVAIDGITAAGKTTLAAELADALRNRGATAIQLSGDDFHHQSAHRYRQGRHNANGYYEDAYDLQALARMVLIPLGPGGDLRYQARYHDLATDELLHDEPETASAGAIVLVEGSFLQRAELADHWDEVIFVETSFAEARRRGSLRDSGLFGGLGRAQHAFDTRYHPASRRYLDEVQPQDRANVVIGNEDITRPQLIRLGLHS